MLGQSSEKNAEKWVLPLQLFPNSIQTAAVLNFESIIRVRVSKHLKEIFWAGGVPIWLGGQQLARLISSRYRYPFPEGMTQ